MNRSASAENAPSEEYRYRLLIEAVKDYAIYMVDSTGLVSSWNPGAERLTGYPTSEVIGRHFSEFYTDEDRAAGLPERTLAIAVRDGKFEGEGWQTHKDGSRFWADTLIEPIRSKSGELFGFAKITRNLAERQTSEAALRRSEEQFRLLVQSVTDYAIFMLDKEGRVTNWNPGAQRIKGYRPGEIVGRHFSNFYTQQDRDRGVPQRALATALREGRYEKEGLRVRKDGSTFWAHVVIDPVRNDAGELIGFAKVTRDITERKKAQRDLELAREVLFHSQKMDAIGQLTGGVAHDFNNLLMAVLGSLELAKKRVTKDPYLVRLLDNAIQGAQRGSTLTQRMLSFARRQSLEPKPIDLKSVIPDMVELLQRSIGPSFTIETHIPSSQCIVLADENQLELALLNLSVNARDAMGDGGTIEISAREETVRKHSTVGLPPGRYVRLSVTDHGEGMPADVLARATEPFFTTKGVGKGTGLGLSMVHGMAEQIGGRFVLHSEKGKGTTAEIWLPVSGDDPEAAETSRPQAEPEEAPPLTVLAVDDDALVLFNTVAMLEDLGHTPREAYSAKQALEVLGKEHIDLVITDQAMPQMSGAQLIDAIKVQWPDLPVILATGYAELPPGADRGLHKLSKPFTERELAGAIAKVVA